MKKQNIGITVTDHCQAQPLQQEGTDKPDCALNVLEVRNIPSQADGDFLQMYFENSKSGGCDGAVEEY